MSFCDGPINDWPNYVNYLVNIRDISHAMMYTLDGSCLHTSDPQVTLSTEEFNNIKNSYTNRRFHTIKIAGKTFQPYHFDNRSGVIGKFGCPATLACTLCKTANLLILAIHKAGGSCEESSTAVMFLGDFFITKNM